MKIKLKKEGKAHSKGKRPKKGMAVRLILSLSVILALSLSIGTSPSVKMPPHSNTATTSTISSGGYWMAGADGSTYNFATLSLGSAAPYHPSQPIVGMATTPDGHGYWLVASDGGVFAFGDAVFYGSMGGKPLNKPIVGMASTPDGKGYWMVASDGGIFSFGDATFYGSMGGKPLNKPIVGMASTADGQGYWMVASDGGIFTFGDATFYGSMGGKTIPAPIVAIAANKGTNPFVPGTTGYDMSNYTIQVPPLGTLAIAESDGYPFLDNRNPTMFKEEAAAAGANLQLYTFLGAPFSSGTWQIAPSPSAYLSGPSGTCSPTNYLCQAVNYGSNEAEHSLLNAQSLGITSNIWWLDVETGGPWSTDLQINNAVIQGAIQYFHSQGILVGIYSTAYQWEQITGGMTLGTATNPLPIWIAAPDYQQAACTDPALWFAGGTPWLVQTGTNTTYNVDTDYAC